MKTINFDEYEIGILVMFLEKLKKEITNDLKLRPTIEGWDDRRYDLEKIRVLLNRLIKNDYKQDYEIQITEYKETFGRTLEEETKRQYYENWKNKKEGRKSGK